MPNWLTTEIVIAGKDAKRFKDNLVEAINSSSDIPNQWNFVKIDDKYFGGCKLVDKTYTKDSIEYTLSKHEHSKDENINYATQNFSSKPIEGCEWIYHVYRVLDGTYKTDEELHSYIHNGFETDKNFKAPLYGRGCVIAETITFNEKLNELRFTTETVYDNAYFIFKSIIEKNKLDVTINALEYEIGNLYFATYGETALKYFPDNFILKVEGEQCDITAYEKLDDIIKRLNTIFVDNKFNKTLNADATFGDVKNAIEKFDNFTNGYDFVSEKKVTYIDIERVARY